MTDADLPDTYRWYGGEALAPDEARMVRLVGQHLADGSALTVDELMAHEDVRRAATTVDGVEGALDDHEAAGHLDQVLEHVDADIAWLLDDRNYLPAAIAPGTTVTVRVTDHLLATGEVVDGPDVAPLAISRQQEFPLADGRVARRPLPTEYGVDHAAPHLVLPDGAVPRDAAVGGLLALSWDGQQLTVRTVDEPDQAAARMAAGVLRDCYETLADHVSEPTVDDLDLVAVARIDHGLFDQPLPPVTELLGAADLSWFGDVVAEADHDWEHWGTQALAQSVLTLLEVEHDLDRDGALALLLLIGAVDAELAALGLLDAAREEIGPPAPDEQLPMLLHACGDPHVADALAGEAAYDDPERAPGLGALAARLRGVARGRERAVAHHLLACAAEAVGDAEEAAVQARRAVQADPQHGGAAWLATRYASLRGSAGEALCHLTAAWEVPPGDVLGDLLRQYARPGPTDAPRNAPCPCGSGRKHKLCCGPSNGWPLPERTPWLLLKARDHVSSLARADELAELVEVFLGDLHGEERERTAAGAAGNAFLQGLLLWEGGVLEEFLDVHAPLLPADELDLGRRWVDAELDLWEVAAVRPGEGLTLSGLYRGASVDVREEALSRTASVGSTYLARVLDAGDHLELPSVWPVDLQLREYLLSEVFPEEPDAFGWAAAMAPRRPTIRNQDGHDLVHHTVTYDLEVSTDTAAAALDARFGPGEDDVWAWIDEDDDVLRGTVELADRRLVAATNSDERRDALDAVLHALFAEALVEVADDAMTLDELLELAHEGRGASPDAAAGMDPTGEDLPPELREAVAARMRETEERWVAEPVPALGGLTPREALDDPTRRGDLLALLDEFDRTPAPPGALTMDVDNLRRLLGLDR